jgi:hypothetical protein
MLVMLVALLFDGAILILEPNVGEFRKNPFFAVLMPSVAFSFWLCGRIRVGGNAIARTPIADIEAAPE